MYAINNKFEIGEECYTAYRSPVKYKCPICEGDGEFTYNGYNIKCRNCNGTGELHDAHMFILDVGKVKIRRIVVNIGTNETTIRYKVDCTDDIPRSVKNRSETTLFKTREEAEEYCKKSNTRQITPEF